MLVSHKQVWRTIREDNLLAARPKAFVTTTDSNHALEIYPQHADPAPKGWRKEDSSSTEYRSEFARVP
jgi:hypothetical protein